MNTVIVVTVKTHIHDSEVTLIQPIRRVYSVKPNTRLERTCQERRHDDVTITMMFRRRLPAGFNNIKIVCSPFIFVGNSLFQHNKMDVMSKTDVFNDNTNDK